MSAPSRVFSLRVRWVIAGLITAGIVAAALTRCGGPSPRLADIADEPLLTAPIPAVELGRDERDSQYGWGLPDVSAHVMVAYEVQVSPTQAQNAWQEAYGDLYHFRVREPDQDVLSGSSEQARVRVYVDTEVRVPGDSEAFREPSPGATVVTISVTGAAS